MSQETGGGGDIDTNLAPDAFHMSAIRYFKSIQGFRPPTGSLLFLTSYYAVQLNSNSSPGT